MVTMAGSAFASQAGSAFASQAGSAFASQAGSAFASQAGSAFASQAGSAVGLAGGLGRWPRRRARPLASQAGSLTLAGNRGGVDVAGALRVICLQRKGTTRGCRPAQDPSDPMRVRSPRASP
jgi:hypothetical protein